MPTVALTENEKRALKVGKAIGGAGLAVAGAVAGAVSDAVRTSQQPAAQPQQAFVVGDPVYPHGISVAQPVYQPQPQQQVTIVHVQPQQQQQPRGLQAGQIVAGVSSAAAYALGGTEYPPRDACLCCGMGCCYQALTSRNWARCHNDMVCCCLSCETCCCSDSMLPWSCCVDHLGCRSPTFECCNCGGCCCQFKVVSPIHTKEMCIGHSQCCFQVSAWAVSSSGCEKVGVPWLVTCFGINCYPNLGCCLVTGDAMNAVSARQAPANVMIR